MRRRAVRILLECILFILEGLPPPFKRKFLIQIGKFHEQETSHTNEGNYSLNCAQSA